jgi:hypothetical protein
MLEIDALLRKFYEAHCLLLNDMCHFNFTLNMVEGMLTNLSHTFYWALITNVREEPKASVLSAYKICDLAYKILKV